MNDLQIFKNEQFGEVRTIFKDGQPWFVAKDISDILGYSETNRMTSRLDEDETISTKLVGMNMNSTLINESGLYNAVLGSQKPEAKKFKKWVTSDVLPSIRKHGAYMTEDTIEKALTSPDFLIQLATRLKEEKAKNELLKNENKVLTPKAEYVDNVLSADGLYTITEIAKDFGFKSGYALNKILNGFKVIRNVNDKWCLYADYCGKGYAKDKITVIKKKDGTNKTVSDLYWTEKGRKFIYDFLVRQELIREVV